ncbi:iron-containing alcohol dehydrogenase [Thiospirochaeta perfilievii]|uniref:Iron-containing alcohol dehydrogenase n=1 Tax=Thiospirochaeta perfilievii TaxID=252967 RepID=A0A5C1QD55_9SPIO|nr:iron-containing alcohol dehydrogenase [Thiospirochaeta perfilievii]QEN04899.1 iron-containing alcohol dehydrogenase [Thiospirochaeta perfilievii]
MTNFDLNLPTQIRFGKKREEEIGSILTQDNITRILFVYGTSSIKSTGLYSRIISILDEYKIEVVEYSGIRPNPLVIDVDRASELGRKSAVQAVLAVGGGSVMDSAKAIAVGIAHKQKIWDFYNGSQIKKALPIYNIVTLAATASEMNGGFVLTNSETKEKLSLKSELTKPKVSILNPELTFTVPPNYTAYSAIDIFAHTIEGYLTSTKSPSFINLLKESVIKTVKDKTELILINPQDYNARAEFMWAATMALNGTTNLGLDGAQFPNHMLEHGVGSIFNIPHGAGLSIVIPAWMRWYKDNNRPQFLRLFKEIFNKESLDEGIEAVENWFHSLGSPIRFSEYNIEESSFKSISEKAYKQAQMWGIDKTYTKEVIMEILLLAK